jgi:hypothetical protein
MQGRLAKDEFDARVSQTFASQTYAELAALTADIPSGRSRTAAPGTGPVAGELGSHGTHMRGHCGSHDGGDPVMVGRCRAPRPAGRESALCGALWLGVRGWRERRRPCATQRCR